MHSKWKIWEFFKNLPYDLKGHKGIIAFYGHQPLMNLLFKQKLKNEGILGREIKVSMGQEMTLDWFENEFKSLGFFQNEDDYFIHNAEQISSNIVEQILAPDDLILDSNLVFLNFNKNDAFFKKLSKLTSSKVKVFEVTAPQFWEDDELLSFLERELGVYLAISAKKLVKEKIPFDIQAYYDVLLKIKIHFPEKKNLEASDILNLIDLQKLDHFELAELFGSRKLDSFYKKVLSLYSEGFELVGAFSFIQSHMIKIYDPSYLFSKARLSKYDKQIQAQSRLWNQNTCIRAIDYLGTLILELKSKDLFTEHHLREKLLQLKF